MTPIYIVRFYCTIIHNNNNYCYIIHHHYTMYLDPCLWAVSNSRPVLRNPRSIQRTWMHPPQEIPRFQGSQHTWSYRNLRRCRTSVLENGSIQKQEPKGEKILLYYIISTQRCLEWFQIWRLAPHPPPPKNPYQCLFWIFYHIIIVIAIALKSNKHKTQESCSFVMLYLRNTEVRNVINRWY